MCPLHIAWIEDMSDIIWSLIKPIADAGNEVRRYTSVRAAVDERDYLTSADLILMDMILPPGAEEYDREYPGAWLVREMRDEWQSKTPIVVLSVVERRQLEASEGRLDVEEYLHKPVRQRDLRKAIADATGVAFAL